LGVKSFSFSCMAAAVRLTVLVTTSTGKVGQHVVGQLIEASVNGDIIVKAATRDCDSFRAKAIAALGAKLVKVDYADPSTLLSALEGVDKVVFISPQVDTHQDITQSWLNAFEALKAQQGANPKLKHIVRLSMITCDDPQCLFAQWHALNEVMLPLCDIKTTFVRSGLFFQDFGIMYGHVIKAMGSFEALVGNGPIAYVDSQDVARLITKILLGAPEAAASLYELRGAEALTMTDMAAALGELLGKPVPFVTLTAQQSKELLLSYNISETMADAIIELAQLCQDKPELFGKTDNSILELTGKPPTTVSQHFKDHIFFFQDRPRKRTTVSS